MALMHAMANVSPFPVFPFVQCAQLSADRRFIHSRIASRRVLRLPVLQTTQHPQRRNRSRRSLRIHPRIHGNKRVYV